MRAAITGGNGFIGKHLSDRLRGEGIEVALLSRELFGNYEMLESTVKDVAPDYIFHLSAYGNHSTQTDEDITFSTNIIYTYLLLKATKDIKYKAFINFGSSSEYGRKHSSMHEDDVLEPITLYGATKGAGTLLSRYFALKYGKPIVTVRPFSVYGEGEADFRFIPTVIRHILKGTLMDLATEPKHDWIYIQDFLDGVLTVAKHADKMKEQAVNIGTGKQYSNLDVVKEMDKISKKILNIDVFGNMRIYDSPNWVANINTLKSYGWSPKHTLTEGLKKTYAYYKQRFKEKNS